MNMAEPSPEQDKPHKSHEPSGDCLADGHWQRALSCLTLRLLADNRFTQQELPSYRLLLSPGWVWLLCSPAVQAHLLHHCLQRARVQVTAVFFLLGLVFVPIGAGCLTAAASVSAQPARLRLEVLHSRSEMQASVQVQEVSQRYDDTCVPGSSHAAKDAALGMVRCVLHDNLSECGTR